RDALARRQANAACALLHLGRPGRVWPLFRHSEHPDLRTHLLHRAGPLEVDARLLLDRLAVEEEPSARQALILARGEYTAAQLPRELREEWTARLLRCYREDADLGVHGAIDWLLRHGRDGPAPRKHNWGQASALARLDGERAARDGLGRVRPTLG